MVPGPPADKALVEKLVAVCHTTMVALDKATMRPIRDKSAPSPIPPLLGAAVAPMDSAAGFGGGSGGSSGDSSGGSSGSAAVAAVKSVTEEVEDARGVFERLALAAVHDEVRRRRHRHTMQLRLPLSMPPDQAEMRALHEAHRK